MLGQKLLVILSDREGLRGLDETTRAFGEVFEIHSCLRAAGPSRSDAADALSFIDS